MVHQDLGNLRGPHGSPRAKLPVPARAAATWISSFARILRGPRRACQGKERVQPDHVALTNKSLPLSCPRASRWCWTAPGGPPAEVPGSWRDSLSLPATCSAGAHSQEAGVSRPESWCLREAGEKVFPGCVPGRLVRVRRGQALRDRETGRPLRADSRSAPVPAGSWPRSWRRPREPLRKSEEEVVGRGKRRSSPSGEQCSLPYSAGAHGTSGGPRTRSWPGAGARGELAVGPHERDPPWRSQGAPGDC